MANMTSVESMIHKQLEQRSKRKAESSADESSDNEEDASSGDEFEAADDGDANEKSATSDDSDASENSDDGSNAASDEESAEDSASGSEGESDNDEEEEDDVDEMDAEPVDTGKRIAKGSEEEEALAGTCGFDELHLSRPLLKAVYELGYTRATPIQAAVIPAGVKGQDIEASAVTGSGKTAAFMLPILERLMYRSRRTAATRVLVLLPTRELAVQCVSMTRRLAAYMDLRVCLVVGGLATTPQEVELRTRPDIVVATPGRLADLLRNSMAIALEDVEILVLDEADRLLETGFRDEIEEIIKLCPTQRQTLLFSATLTEGVNRLASLALKNPLRVAVDPMFSTARKLTQEVIRVRHQHENSRQATVLALCLRTFKKGVLVFVPRRTDCHRMRLVLGLSGLKAGELHGDMTQLQRLEALEEFRDGKVDYLVATDVAARGLDVAGVFTVINMYMPKTMRDYVHRVGRTARAGRVGRAVTLVGDRERTLLKAVIKHAKDAVKRRVVPVAAIEACQDSINNMYDEITRILQQEREEREILKAEMQATKANNIIEHAEEIHKRPAKTWMVSERNKKEIRDRAYEETLEEGAAAGNEDAAAELTQRRSKKPRTGKKGKFNANDDDDDDDDDSPAEKKPKRDKYAGMPRAKRRRMQQDAGEDETDAARLARKADAAVRRKKRESRDKEKQGIREKHRAAKGKSPKKARPAAAAAPARGPKKPNLEHDVASGSVTTGRSLGKRPFKKPGANAFKSKRRHKRR
eukprot:TRINITY_DN9342_c0_g1_i1.p1 TRINITY_DN9342_c0_g1~~TRINITY_DN9342_c0_g1_i1.p1  ORF type:complete len:816 (-),score=204.55 TRINITY_DN9342_c0_g1_i1:51-2312(-)